MNQRKVLKIKLHQHTGVYRNPITAEVIESYPLPPPSTIIGLIQSLLKIVDPIEGSFNISIQGDYNALLRDYQWYIRYDDNTKKYVQQRKPILVHTLFDVSLTIHLIFQDIQIGLKVEKLLKAPPYFIYLGRAEDIVKIEEVNWVEFSKEFDDSVTLNRSALIPGTTCTKLNISGVPYQMSGFYKYLPLTLGKETKVIRQFQWLNLFYVENDFYQDDYEDEVELIKDEEGDLIWWSMQNPTL